MSTAGRPGSTSSNGARSSFSCLRKVLYLTGPVERYTYRYIVVTIFCPSCCVIDPYDYVIKRLVALEGDIIVNSNYSPKQPVVIGKGACWIEGDNDNSVDSNSEYGPISKGLIFAKVREPLSLLKKGED